MVRRRIISKLIVLNRGFEGSNYHVISYNETNGDVIRKFTVQGYADNRYVLIIFPPTLADDLDKVLGQEVRIGLLYGRTSLHMASHRASVGYLWVCSE